MDTDKRLEDKISSWLEAEAPRQLPDRVLKSAFERTRTSPQQHGWRRLWTLGLPAIAPALGAAVALVILVLALGLLVNRTGIGGTATPEPTAPTSSPAPSLPAVVIPPSAALPQESVSPSTPAATASSTPPATATPSHPPDGFVGNWKGRDNPPDRSHLTIQVIAEPAGAFAVTVRDDYASVCKGVSSTMTGVAEPLDQYTYVIAQPEYLCDDGSTAEALSGPPLSEQLRNFTFTYEPERDVLIDGGGIEFRRVQGSPQATP